MKLIALGVVATLFSGSAALADELQIATNQGNVPFEFENAEGKTVGFEIDMINEVAKRLNHTVTVTPMPFNSLFSAVQSGRADIALAAITITNKRLESVSFAQPYFDSDQCLGVSEASGVKTLADLDGKSVGADTGSSGEMWAKENQQKYKVSEVRGYEGVAQGMLDVAAGRLGGYVIDCPIVMYYIKDKPNLKVAATMPTGEKYSLMMAKDSKRLESINATLTEMKKDGTMASIYKTWFGVDAAAGAAVVTEAAIPTLK